MRDIEAARTLLHKAKNDLSALVNMMDEEAFSEDIFGFHAQQSIEKALKAWLAALGALFPKTHDITLLLQLLEQKGEDIAKYEDFLEYNMYAVQFRYEDFDMTDQPIDRAECIKQVKVLINHVDAIIMEIKAEK